MFADEGDVVGEIAQNIEEKARVADDFEEAGDAFGAEF